MRGFPRFSVQPFLTLAVTILLAVLLVPVHNAWAQDQIAVGKTVKVVTGSSDRLRLREAPGLQKPIVGYLQDGAVMRVINGPENADNYQWWELEGNNHRGWAASTFLRVVEGAAVTAAPAATVGVPVTPADADSGNSEATIDGSGLVDSYGFSSLCFSNFRLYTIQDPNWFDVDLTITALTVKNANKMLNQAGFQSRYHDNANAKEALDQLTDKEIFFFFGHGANNLILFRDSQCNQSALTRTRFSTKRLPHLKLALLLACSTGHDTSANDNILSGFREIGAKKAIGFRRDMPMVELFRFSDLYWQYTLKDGMEAGDAARKAASEARVLFLHRIKAADVVILGTEDVYLKPEKSGIKLPFRKWLDDLQKGWEDFWRNLQRRIAEMLEQEWQLFLRKLFDTLLAAVQQCCMAPFGLAVVGSLPLWLRWRRKQSQGRKD